MKLKQDIFGKLKQVQAFTPVLVVGMLMLTGAVIYQFNARAASVGFYFTSSSTAYRVGDTVTVGVRENSGTDCANVAQADFTYPANLLRYESFNSNGGAFESNASSSAGNGSVSIAQFTTRKACNGNTTSGIAGDNLIANVVFTVIAPGNATLSFKPSSIAVSSADNKTNVAPGSTSRTFALSAPVTPPPPTPPGPGPTPPAPAPTPTPPAPGPTPPSPRPSTPSPRPSTTSPRPVTSFTPANTDTSIPVTNNDVIQLETPTDVNPFPVQPDGINKIEYFLNTKLVATVKTPPYNYRLDTTKLLNGKYNLTTKTHYANGQIKSVSQTVIVKNPFGWTQFKLRMQKMAWLIILLVLVAGAAVAAWIIHKRNGGGSDDYYDDGTYEMDGSYTPDNFGDQSGNTTVQNDSQMPSTYAQQSAVGTPGGVVSPQSPPNSGAATARDPNLGYWASSAAPNTVPTQSYGTASPAPAPVASTQPVPPAVSAGGVPTGYPISVDTTPQQGATQASPTVAPPQFQSPDQSVAPSYSDPAQPSNIVRPNGPTPN